MQFLSYLHDPDNLYLPLLDNTIIPNELIGTTVAVSGNTTTEVKTKVKEMGFNVIEGGLYGIARIKLLKYALENLKDEFYFVCDFDKFLHWVQTNREELESILDKVPTYDLTIIARSDRAISTYPETWTKTERIASRILAKITNQYLDFMNGPSILSNTAANLVVENAQEKGVGSCVEFCVISHQAGLTIGAWKVDGLTWEDPDRYKKLIDSSKSYDDWKYDTFHSLYEWRKRVDFLHAQVKVMIRLTEEPINPKYPAVQNKTFQPN
ncbi:hypothetical protein ACFL0C_01290 [Patescibacteria group bacterium]